MKRATAIFVIALVAVAFAAGILAPRAATRSSEPGATTKVTVAASEFKFKLLKRIVPKGTVIFAVVNKGKLAHDFKIAGKKTPLIAPGKSATLRVTFAKKGKYRYLCTVPGHAPAGMKGVLTVTG